MQQTIYCLLVFSLLLALLTRPMGLWLAPLAAGRAPRLVDGTDRLVLRLLGLKPLSQNWLQFAFSALIFNTLGACLLYVLLRLQGLLPLNPEGVPGLAPAQAFNVAISFVTGTNWQSYRPEQQLSYFSQTVGLAVQNFACAATGIAVSFALIRGFSQKFTDRVGNFWIDLTHITLWLLLPLSLLYALFLVSQGVIQNYSPYLSLTTLEGAGQTLAMGPVAAQEAIKMLGTNGGGFFAANSAHPFENPSQLTNFVSCLAIMAIPSGLTYCFGLMVRDVRQGWTIWAAMWLVFAASVIGFAWFESQTPGVLSQLGFPDHLMNPEGKEARFDLAATALFSISTTAASSGAVNAMHDSFSAMGGFFPLWLMQIDEVVFGGVGMGLCGMLVFTVVGVFTAGLMAGRTPEYVGKKITASQMKLACVALLTVPSLILLGTALTCLWPGVSESLTNQGPQGFSEFLYAWSSAANNNGSAFAGLAADQPFFNIGLALAMWLGRFVPMIVMVALAGTLSTQTSSAAGAVTLKTYGLVFTIFLSATVVIVGTLTYFPALSLGPLAVQTLPLPPP